VQYNTVQIGLDDAAWWNGWSPEAHARFRRIQRIPTAGVPGRFSLVPSVDIPGWLAELTAGQLAESDAPTLSLGTISAGPAELHWGSALDEHPGELHPYGPNGPAGPTWADLVHGCDLMQRCGFRPVLDVEIEVLPDARLGLTWSSVVTGDRPDLTSPAWPAILAHLHPVDVHLPVTTSRTGSTRLTEDTATSTCRLTWLWGLATHDEGTRYFAA
jgi:hypothetical protein